MGAKAEAAKMTAAATAANRRTSSLLSCHEDRVSYRYRSSLGATPTPDASERRTEGGILGTRRRVCRLYHHAAQLLEPLRILPERRLPADSGCRGKCRPKCHMAIGRGTDSCLRIQKVSSSKGLTRLCEVRPRKAMTNARLAAEKCAEPSLGFEPPGETKSFPEGNLVCGKHGLPDRGFELLEPRNGV